MKLPVWYPPILTYHQVASARTADTPTVSPERFDQQMGWLKQRWKPIPLDRLVDALEQGTSLDRRSVVVTFDDGTAELFTNAFPALVRHEIPATVFLIVGRIGTPGFLSWNQIHEMARQGITFGSHTLNHDYLPEMALPDAEKSLADSKRQLEEQGMPAKHLSYPAGGFTREIAEAARRIGYRSACTTNRGFRRLPIDRWALRRVTIHESVRSPAALWLKCCGWAGWNRRLRKPA